MFFREDEQLFKLTVEQIKKESLSERIALLVRTQLISEQPLKYVRCFHDVHP